MSIPLTGIYATFVNSFFGDLDGAAQQALWEQFAAANGYSISNPPPETIAVETQFLQYAKGIFELNQQLVLSPEEVKKRNIMFATFNILLEMLSTLQNTVAVQGKNLIFYGKWQEEYTKMLTRVPTYVGDTNSAQQSPGTLTADNLDQLKFGYNSMTAQDLAEWWADNATKGNTESFTLATAALSNNTTPPIPLMRFTINTATGSGPFQLQTIQADGTAPAANGSLPLTLSSNPDPTQAYQENLNAFKTAFAEYWNTNVAPYQQSLLSNLPVIRLNQTFVSSTRTNEPATGTNYATGITALPGEVTLGVPWMHTFVTPAGSTDTNLQKAGDAASKRRGEINSRLQQYIENVRSLREVVQNTAKQVESNLTQTKEAITQQSQLLTSIMESLKSLIAAIFRS